MNKEITKKFLKIVVLTLLISYGLDKLVFFSLNKISDKVMTGQSIGKLNQFLSVKDTTAFLVFGNSRANRHIDVDMVGHKGYNMGIDGTGIAYNSALINTLTENKKQFILVHIDTKNFFDTDYEGADIRGLKTKYQRDTNITTALEKSGQLSVLQQFYYSMNYNGNAIGIIKNYFKPSYNYKTYNGYDPISVSADQESMRDIVLSNFASDKECLDNHEVNTMALDYLKSIKTFVEKSPNKTFLFVTSPIYNDTCDLDNIKLAKIMQDLGLEYRDYSNLYKESKDNSLWKDATHMSKKGAEAFSKLLAEKFKNSKY
ncbi:hypothetical protein [uncultured Winogradskyella sp.]|uniref:hypothetical protein n=1 Tax=uncultured Winogradskyella sp. TaxID=395353 RepID=UPI00261938F3|nr:hypothetical protein [uncultured Winogradskyella sp.]